MSVKIKAFIIAFNESETIEFTIKHYQKYCNEVHIYDNHSTDNTREIAASMGCIIHTFGKKGVLDDRAYLEVKNNCWKSHTDTDYVIVCDADEILDLEDFYNCTGVFEANRKPEHIIRGIGYNIYSETLPLESWDEKRLGFRDTMYDKALMFDPSFITEINYGYGAHGARPNFNWNESDMVIESLNLYHMRYVGGFERLLNRYNVYHKRMCDFNIKNGLGVQYLKSESELAREWESVKVKCVEVY